MGDTLHSSLSAVLCRSHERSAAGRLVAAANYASAMLASPIEVLYAIVDLSIGIFIIGLVML